MSAKVIEKISFRQTPSSFVNKDTDETIEYMAYEVFVNNRWLKVKPVNAESKVRLTDAFDTVKENKNDKDLPF